MINHPKNVYVVDDDASLRKALERLLKSAGYATKSFGSAEEFLERIPEKKSACLILDIRMTGMNGLQLQKKLSEGGFDVPIIFITAHDDPQTFEQALLNGARAILRKPFDETFLLGEIEFVFSGDSPNGHSGTQEKGALPERSNRICEESGNQRK